MSDIQAFNDKFSLDYIFQLLDNAPTELEFKGKQIIKIGEDLVYRKSDRYTLFKQNNKCVCCGLEGTHFKKTESKQAGIFVSCHLNLYGINENGEEILFTKDHIIPKSKGGKNSMSNYQTMCSVCNELKADKIISIQKQK